MIVGICGFGYTGSGAIRDYLKEFDEVSVAKDVELSFLYDPDGILELEYRIATNPIRFFSGDAAIKRFKKYITSYDLCKYMTRGMSKKKFKHYSLQYINDITSARWNGFWHFDKRNINYITYVFKYIIGWKFLRIFDKLHIDNSSIFPNKPMFLPVDSNVFYKKTIEFTDKLLYEICNVNKEILVLDQPFPANNPECCYKFFRDDCKAIVVTRDPRDLYCFVKKYGGTYSRFIPSRNVEQFVAYYSYQMKIQVESSERVLVIRFEDLIYKYDEIVNIINKFLNIHKHNRPKKYFNPEVSSANTQIFLRCKEYSEDIKFIEKNLSEYLYSFENTEINYNLTPFL